MNKICEKYIDRDWLSSAYSAIFTRSTFEKILRNDDYSIFQSLLAKSQFESTDVLTCHDLIVQAYKFLLKNYRNEYVYKNTLISTVLKEYGTRNTVMFNEFPVGNSIADFVLFNGISRVFEIKTELDSERRLCSQLKDYKRLFQQCYLVVHESQVDKYADIDPEVGIVALSVSRGNAKLTTIRDSVDNEYVDPYVLMTTLRTDEYKEMVLRYYGELPQMNVFNAFTICRAAISKIPSKDLNRLFLEIMKERKTNSNLLKSFDRTLRQICLSLHFSQKDYEILNEKLLTPVNI